MDDYGLSHTEFWMTPKQARRAHQEAEKERELNLGTYVGIYCCICRKEGHYAVWCPERKKSREKMMRMDIVCFKCKETGHFVHKCPKIKKKPTNLGKEKKCFRCKEVGHLARDCPLKKGDKKSKGKELSTLEIMQEEGTTS